MKWCIGGVELRVDMNGTSGMLGAI